MADDVTLITDLLEARLLAPEPHRATRIGLVVPTSGTLGMLAPAALSCASLARSRLRKGGRGRPTAGRVPRGKSPPLLPARPSPVDLRRQTSNSATGRTATDPPPREPR
ncbi:hypothetical protein [Planosporangium mesophilum]|uniref:hypothetical protein n=1 Tax=Planosporangium mesophilum TaxID=689768 RepID=UPI0019506733|nr:hypothetical protein [Planosporangium mesophilum]